MRIDAEPVVDRIIPPAAAGVGGQRRIALRHQKRDAGDIFRRESTAPEGFPAVDRRREAREVEETVAPGAVRMGQAEGRVVPFTPEVADHEEVDAAQAVAEQPPVGLGELPAGTGMVVAFGGEHAAHTVIGGIDRDAAR